MTASTHRAVIARVRRAWRPLAPRREYREPARPILRRYGRGPGRRLRRFIRESFRFRNEEHSAAGIEVAPFNSCISSCRNAVATANRMIRPTGICCSIFASNAEIMRSSPSCVGRRSCSFPTNPRRRAPRPRETGSFLIYPRSRPHSSAGSRRRNVLLTYLPFRRTWTLQDPDFQSGDGCHACALRVH